MIELPSRNICSLMLRSFNSEKCCSPILVVPKELGCTAAATMIDSSTQHVSDILHTAREATAAHTQRKHKATRECGNATKTQKHRRIANEIEIARGGGCNDVAASAMVDGIVWWLSATVCMMMPENDVDFDFWGIFDDHQKQQGRVDGRDGATKVVEARQSC